MGAHFPGFSGRGEAQDCWPWTRPSAGPRECWALKGNTAWRTGTWDHEMLFTYTMSLDQSSPSTGQGHKAKMIFRFHSRVPLMEWVGENPSEPMRQNILEQLDRSVSCK